MLEKYSDISFSETVRVEHRIYLPNPTVETPGTLSLRKGGIKEEVKKTANNIMTALQADGLSLKNIINCTVILADMLEWSSFNEVYVTFFTKQHPARSALDLTIYS